ncbi:hypothetical protein AR679_gp214 [Yellowstone lake phycodnavirus 1]|jgi:hypothetical protein|uniref:hypothetical protein n=1 Tax=Yellowstone lake phycodnavirus 1 TaxID=1586713 RepID=UPI0006EBDB57|nr:hypothetical protein AR679_gp214 [Yellowstone lake phycodnavirus 1]BAT22240.1 hypothetical protein [Yellowstone lake phycodnavirus 1]
MGITKSKPVYHLFTTGYAGNDIFIGGFSTREKAIERAQGMCLRRHTWVDLDQIDTPVDVQNTVWVLELPSS